MEKQDVLLHIWLSKSFSFGSVMPLKILKHYNGSIKKFYENLEKEILNFKITEKSKENLRKIKLKDCEEIFSSCEKLNIKTICYNEEKYPKRLREIKSAPIILYYYGNLNITFKPCISIVGTRNCTQTAFETAKEISKKLVEFGITTISGCARGIDTAVHQATLKSGGFTVSVLGTPLNSSYPHENKELKKNIIKSGGLLLSEYPPKTITSTWHFPVRNRIISAMSDCVVVVQSKEKSGTIITAQKALEYGKKVFFLPPSNIFNNNSLVVEQCLKKGASLLFNFKDILKIYENSQYPLEHKAKENLKERQDLKKLPEKFLNIVKIVGKENRLDTILKTAEYKTNEVLFILTQLEILNILQKTKTGYKTKVN